ncbi:MAG: hypothetical protein HXK61_03785 [Atopobiaceae bacterium]|nr:hypothetical protein [Atopobiaceae bacterium]
MQVLRATQLSTHGVRRARGPRARCAHRARDPRAHSGHARDRNVNGHAHQQGPTARARMPAQILHEVHDAASRNQ